jgi:hypothetical protein
MEKPGLNIVGLGFEVGKLKFTAGIKDPGERAELIKFFGNWLLHRGGSISSWYKFMVIYQVHPCFREDFNYKTMND